MIISITKSYDGTKCIHSPSIPTRIETKMISDFDRTRYCSRRTRVISEATTTAALIWLANTRTILRTWQSKRVATAAYWIT